MDNEQEISVGLRFYLLFAAFTLLLFPVHEFGHYLVYRVLGVHLHMTLNTASPENQSLRRPIAELAGPLVNLLIASGGALDYRTLRPAKPWLAASALASSMLRLTVYCLIVGVAVFTGSGLSMGNDEPIAARLWGIPSLTFVALFAVPFVAIVWSVARTFRASRPRTILHVLALGFVALCLGMLIGSVIDPWLFPSRH
jgi:hypothetical protein